MPFMKQLLAEIAACRLCAEQLPREPRPVLHLGPESRRARILVVGQAPGTRVHETGIPFNDPSGERLRDWMGVDRETFYDRARIAIVPMGFCYPGRGAGGDLPPRRECARRWRRDLLAELTSIELILAVGRYAQDWHLRGRQQRNLTETVRRWRDYGPGLIPLPHPSPRNNRWLRINPWFEEDLLPALRRAVAARL